MPDRAFLLPLPGISQRILKGWIVKLSFDYLRIMHRQLIFEIIDESYGSHNDTERHVENKHSCRVYCPSRDRVPFRTMTINANFCNIPVAENTILAQRQYTELLMSFADQI